MTGCRLGRRGGAALAGVALLAVLAGCGGARALGPRTEFIPFSPEQKTELRTQATRAYRIQEGDVLRVRFAYERALDQDGVLVLSDGTVSLVGIEPLRLAGLTVSQADSLLTAEYSKEYREPALSVILLETRGRRVYVLGEVKEPGYYQVPVGGTDVMSAIALARGFSDDASPEGTVIVRVTPEGYQFQEVDLGKFGKSSFGPFATVQLQPYDIVFVPRSRSGNFAYFAKSILTGLGQISRIAYEIRGQADSNFGGY